MDEDITDIIVEGKLSTIIAYLLKLYARGYRKIHFDGYNASIHAYKEKK